MTPLAEPPPLSPQPPSFPAGQAPPPPPQPSPWPDDAYRGWSSL